MGEQTKRNPRSFFKVFDAIKFSSKLHIPSAFTSQMEGNLPERAVLRDGYGNMWPVQLARIESEWYFGEGWAKVAQDNSLEHHDIIVFKFQGGRLFDFKIAGGTSNEKKEGVGSVKKGVGSLKFTLEDEEMGEEEEEEDSRGKGKHEAVANAKSKKNTDDDFYGLHLFKSGRFVQPNNPYFIGKIRPSRRHELYIPVDVAKDFQFTLPEKILLRDSTGRSWKSKLSTWTDGRTFYTGEGWASLCRVNFIKEEDKCICEFLLGNGEPVLQIQVVRAT